MPGMEPWPAADLRRGAKSCRGYRVHAGIARLAGIGVDGQRLGRRAQRLPGLLYPAAESALRRRGRRLSGAERTRSEEHTSELQSLMRISYAVFCLKKKTTK